METVGAVVSRTVTANDECPVLPDRSAAVQTTEVLPIGNTAPDVGVQETSTAPSTPSVAAGVVYVTAAPFGPVASATRSAAAATIGATVSTMFNVPVAAAPS